MLTLLLIVAVAAFMSIARPVSRLLRQVPRRNEDFEIALVGADDGAAHTSGHVRYPWDQAAAHRGASAHA